MNDHVTIRQWISRRRLRAAVDRSLGAKVPKAVFDEAEAYARRKMAFQNEALGLDRGDVFVCPFCCAELARTEAGIPRACPECGQPIERKKKP